MSSKKLITILIATYNSDKTLSKCLASISNQSFKNFNFMVADGGSSDKTIHILQSYKNDHSNFLFVSEPDRGIYDAINKLIKKIMTFFVQLPYLKNSNSVMQGEE